MHVRKVWRDTRRVPQSQSTPENRGSSRLTTRRRASMTSRNIAGGHVLPPNPEFLEFERTDGDVKQWPTNTKEVVDGDGHVNYMKPLGPDDSSNIHWRSQVAMKAAERLG